MHIEEPLQKAIGRFDWAAVEKRMKAVATEDLREWAENLIDVILRDGYLILRRPNDQKKSSRDQFLNELKAAFREQGFQGLLDEREERFESLAHVETAYHEILATVAEKLLTLTTPAEFAWAAIKLPERAFRHMKATVLAALPTLEHMIDPVTMKLPVDQEGVPTNPDDMLNLLQSTLTSTLKMLAYANDWFDRDGVLVLPTLVPTKEEHDRLANGNVYLAGIWRQLERSDGRCRYFGGSVTREELLLREDDGTMRTGDTIRFSFEDGRETDLHVAGERLRRMVFGFDVDLRRDKRIAEAVVDATPVPAAPEGYVSVEEVHGALTLSHFFFRSIFAISQDFAGLNLAEWLRGYAVIRKLARGHLEGPTSPDGVVLVDESELVKSLTDHGLPEAKARTFLRHTCFGKDSADLFDASFVRCSDRRLYFAVTAAAYSNLAFVVMSQLSTLGCNMTWKGVPFEESVIRVFQDHGVDADGIHRDVDGEEFQVDCVAHWGNVLFVLESKNYSLPGDNAQQEFWFLHDQEKAVRQALKKVEVIEANPEIVSEALGKQVTWDRLVPIVLNGTPFSLPGSINGVYIFDSSALRRFFEEGFLALTTDRKEFETTREVPVGVTRLWAGEKPQPEDLIRQLEEPAQVKQAAHFWTRRWQALPLSDRLNLATILLDRAATTPELVARSIGVDEAALRTSIEESARRDV